MRLLIVAVVFAVTAGWAGAQEKFYLTSDGKVEKRVEEHSKKIETLEKEVSDLKAKVADLQTTCKAAPAAKVGAPYTDPFYDAGQKCKCGCNETGKCTCKTCNERTGDPNFPRYAPPVGKPIVNPNYKPGRVTAFDGSTLELCSDGFYRTVGWPNNQAGWDQMVTPAVQAAPYYNLSQSAYPTTAGGTTCVGGVCYPNTTRTGPFGRPRP